jgi:tetraacyldisaccharide 4'-kinase
MRMQPKFWEKKNYWSDILLPISYIYYLIIFFKSNLIKSKKSTLPIICVGNITIGGAGKTPVVEAFAKICRSIDKNAAILLRGYGGNNYGPVKVNNEIHSSIEVGDEAILHSTNFITWVSRNRYQAAKKIEGESDVDIIIMDDGLQNKSLTQDLKVLVFDGSKGVGNERMIPAGPLREPFYKGVLNSDICIIIGDDVTGLKNLLYKVYPKLKLLKADIIPDPKIVKNLEHKRIVAFAGIGIPEKFFSTLKKLNLELIETVKYPDHKNYDVKEIKNLMNLAEQKNALLVTTEKDMKRINSLKIDVFKNIVSLPIQVKFENQALIKKIVEKIFHEFNEKV